MTSLEMLTLVINSQPRLLGVYLVRALLLIEADSSGPNALPLFYIIQLIITQGLLPIIASPTHLFFPSPHYNMEYYYYSKMTDILEKKQEQLEITKHTQESSIIEERLPHKNKGEAVRRYTRGRLLGKGGFAKCFEVTCLDTKKVSAIKIVNKQNLKKAKAKQKLITEIKIHKTLKHRRVVGFDHVFEDNDNVYILLELCTNNTLNDILKKRKRLTEYEAQYFISQLVEGLSYLHSCKVIHRDLKLGNLLMTDGMEMKIGDFGLAARIQMQGERKKTICGTPNYIAPQILQGKGHSYEVDIWSTGVILYALLYGRPPFETSDVKKTYKKIKECQYSFNDQIQVSNSAKSLISKLLVIDPAKRLTLEQIKNHPFLAEAKIPQALPVSILSEALPKSFIQSQGRRKTMEKVGDSRLQSGMSDRLLLRSSSGLSRNYFSKMPTEKNCNPRLTTNNFFSVVNLPESNKKARETILNGNFDTHFVKKWVDYSSKYGLGYLLSNKGTGIYFNDCSKIVLASNGQNVEYVSASGQLTSYSMSSPPVDREMAKKFTLMQYFSKYLNGGSSSKQENSQTQLFCYVKKWAKSEQGIIFRLSNKVIQVNFVDKSQMVVYAHKNVGVFSGISLGSEKIFFELEGSESKHPVLAKKIEQMGVLIKMLSRNHSKSITKEDKEIFVVEDI